MRYPPPFCFCSPFFQFTWKSVLHSLLDQCNNHFHSSVFFLSFPFIIPKSVKMSVSDIKRGVLIAIVVLFDTAAFKAVSNLVAFLWSPFRDGLRQRQFQLQRTSWSGWNSSNHGGSCCWKNLNFSRGRSWSSTSVELHKLVRPSETSCASICMQWKTAGWESSFPHLLQ